jgi:CspA family cold shock protein
MGEASQADVGITCTGRVAFWGAGSPCRALCAFEQRGLSEAAVPTGTVKWYDSEKGFGFITSDEGDDVFVHVSTLPAGVSALKPGSKVEFGVVDGRRGKQALSVLSVAPSVVKSSRKPADDMAVIVEDVIKLLDGISNQLRRGKYPPDASAQKVAAVLRAVANDLDI